VIEIINGDRGESIGYLPGPNGTLVPIYGTTPRDWLDARLRCIGEPPQPHELGLGGGLLTITDNKGFITGYTYDPSGDEQNKADIAKFQAELQAWTARADIIKQAFDSMFEKNQNSQ
jgi:hypothetical protein